MFICKWQGVKLPGSSDPCWFGQDQMLERRLVAGAVAYSAMFLDHEVQVDLKAATVMLGLKEKLEKNHLLSCESNVQVSLQWWRY